MYRSPLSPPAVVLLAVAVLGGCGGGGGDVREEDAPLDTPLDGGPFTPGAGPGSEPPAIDAPPADDPPVPGLPTVPSGGGTTLTWRPCGGDVPLECTTLSVPLDHDAPDGERIGLALNRAPARDAARRRGSLLLNPGGPGGSGLSLVADLLEFGTVPRTILDEYDLVGFDPRGVGASERVICDDSALAPFDAYPTSRRELDATLAAFARFSDRCAARQGRRLEHLGSLDVVRDMELIRRALGEARLQFIGYSYGTRLAGLYLQRFPERAGRMVLDGSVRPNADVLSLVDTALLPRQRNHERMLASCTRDDAGCDPLAFGEALQARVDLLDARGDIDELTLLLGVASIASEVPILAEVTSASLLPYLERGDRRRLDRLAELLEIAPGGQGGPSDVSNIAVLCADDAARPGGEELAALFEPFNALSDLFAERSVLLAGLCAGWPAAAEPAPAIRSAEAPASLIIGGPTDAQTPIAWGEEMAQAIGGTFLRSEHEGHTVAFTGQSRCVDAAVVAFLRDGTLPERSVCPAETPFAASALRLRRRAPTRLW